MTIRRAIVIALAIPYSMVMWPRWAVRDLAAAFREGYRQGRGL